MKATAMLMETKGMIFRSSDRGETMDTGFAEKIYIMMQEIAPDLPREYRRLVSALQDTARDWPQELRMLGQYGDERFFEICMSAEDREESISGATEMATNYLCSRYLLEEKWARHLSGQVVAALWAVQNDRPIEWIATQGAALPAEAGCAENKRPRPPQRRKVETFRQDRKKTPLIILGVGVLTVILTLSTMAIFGWLPGDGSEDINTAGSSQEESEGGSGTETASGDSGEFAEAAKPSDRVFAHRGTDGRPDDSYESFNSAIDDGATHIEQDVQLAEDGELYVSVNMMSLGDYRGQGKPRLRDLFEEYGKKITYVIELKARTPEGVSALISLIDRYGYEDNVIVQCFDYPEYGDHLREIKNALPEVRTMLLCDYNNHGGQDAVDWGCSQSYVDMIFVSYEDGLMTEYNARKVHEAGKLFGAWVLDGKEEILEAIHTGLDCYFTHYPALALSLEDKYRKEGQR